MKSIKLLTIPEVVEILRVSESKVRKMVFYRKIKHIKIGRNVRVNIDTLKEMILKSEIESY